MTERHWEDWDHNVAAADWSFNTDNQQDAAIEHLPSDKKGHPSVRRVTGADEDVQKIDPDAEVEDESPDEEAETTDDQEAPAPVVQGQVPGGDVSPELDGYFEPADDPSQFEPGTNVIMEGLPGEVIEAFPIEGETYIKLKLSSGISGYFHWKDLLVYVPTEDELREQMMAEMGMEPDETMDEDSPDEDTRQAGTPQRGIESSAISVVKRIWDRVAAPLHKDSQGVKKAWHQVKRVEPDQEVNFKGHKVRIVGRLTDGMVHVQSGSFDELVHERELRW